MQHQADSNIRPQPDADIVQIADYVHDGKPSFLALQTAQLCLMDSIGCALMASSLDACKRHLGPLVPGATMAGGAQVVGTAYQLEPVKAAFDNGILIRWLDFNDTWLAAEWGHPSDNLGGILATADYLSRRGVQLTVADILAMMVKAHEIQGILALENSFNHVGLDHVVLVKVASAAVCARLLGASKEKTIAAISHAWADGQALRVYRHAPNTGSRKSWAAGDATSRGLRLALMALAGEAVIPGVLSTPTWGFFDVSFGGNPFVTNREYGSYVMENILFKVSFPAEFHAQTAVECAMRLHPMVADKIDAIERIRIDTQKSAVRIISKTGPLDNPADRDHCIQYMTAIPLLFGRLTAADYEDDVAANPCIDALRAKMEVVENPQYSRDYLNPDKRSIANAVQVFFKDGSASERVEIEYPLGHKRRREESIPHLQAKFGKALESVFTPSRCSQITELFTDNARLQTTLVRDFCDLLAVE